MKAKFAALTLFFSIVFQSVSFGAGGPLNEDLTPLAVPSQKAIDAGKAGDSATFIKEAEDALAQAKASTPSAGTQRIIGRLKAGVNLGKTGKLAEGVQAVEEALSDMKKSGPPKFGGGT